MAIQQLNLPTVKSGYRSQASDTSIETDGQTHPFLTGSAVAQAIAQAFLGDNCPQGFIPTGTEMTWNELPLAGSA